MKKILLTSLLICVNFLVLSGCNRGKEINGLEIASLPSKLVYYVGESISLDDISVDFLYNDGSKELLPADIEIEISPSIFTEVGEEIIVTISYLGFTDSFCIEVKQKDAEPIFVEVEFYDGDRCISKSKYNLTSKTFEWESEDAFWIVLQSKSNHEFIGWFFDAELTIPFINSLIDQDMKIYGKWIPNEDTEFEYVSIKIYDGNEVFDEFKTKKNKRMKYPNYDKAIYFSKLGFDFDGIYLDSKFDAILKDDTIISSDLILYVKWKEVVRQDGEFFVHFYDGDRYLGYITQWPGLLEQAFKPGYMFIGWHIDKEMTTFWNLENDEDINVYGYWIEDVENHDTHPHYFPGWGSSGCEMCEMVQEWFKETGEHFMTYHNNPFHDKKTCDYCQKKD